MSKGSQSVVREGRSMRTFPHLLPLQVRTAGQAAKDRGRVSGI